MWLFTLPVVCLLLIFMCDVGLFESITPNSSFIRNETGVLVFIA